MTQRITVFVKQSNVDRDMYTLTTGKPGAKGSSLWAVVHPDLFWGTPVHDRLRNGEEVEVHITFPQEEEDNGEPTGRPAGS